MVKPLFIHLSTIQDFFSIADLEANRSLSRLEESSSFEPYHILSPQLCQLWGSGFKGGLAGERYTVSHIEIVFSNTGTGLVVYDYIFKLPVEDIKRCMVRTR